MNASDSEWFIIDKAQGGDKDMESDWKIDKLRATPKQTLTIRWMLKFEFYNLVSFTTFLMFPLDFTWFVDICNNITFLISSFLNSPKEIFLGKVWRKYEVNVE